MVVGGGGRGVVVGGGRVVVRGGVGVVVVVVVGGGGGGGRRRRKRAGRKEGGDGDWDISLVVWWHSGKIVVRKKKESGRSSVGAVHGGRIDTFFRFLYTRQFPLIIFLKRNIKWNSRSFCVCFECVCVQRVRNEKASVSRVSYLDVCLLLVNRGYQVLITAN